MSIRHVRTKRGMRLDFNRKVYTDLKDRVGRNRLATVGAHMKGELQNVLQGPRSGRMYGSHQASAPGEPPAKETGNLRDSIEWQLSEDRRGNLHVEVGTDVEYGLMLERGTSRILPRPWLRPTFERERDNIQREMSRPWT